MPSLYEDLRISLLVGHLRTSKMEKASRIGSSRTFWKRSMRCELRESTTSTLSVLSAARPATPSSSWHVRRQSASSRPTAAQNLVSSAPHDESIFSFWSTRSVRLRFFEMSKMTRLLLW